MAFMRNLWDGTLSLVAAVGTVVIVGVPLWCAHLAISYGIADQWAYVPMAALLVVGGIMVMAFLRKAAGGVAPLRERKRR
jgi:hypothetical protein